MQVGVIKTKQNYSHNCLIFPFKTTLKIITTTGLFH